MGLLQRLGGVVRSARLEAGCTQLDIGTIAGVSHGAISRLERGKSWPRKLDAILAAYAQETGISERELWRRAAE